MWEVVFITVLAVMEPTKSMAFFKDFVPSIRVTAMRGECHVSDLIPLTSLGHLTLLFTSMDK